MASRRYKGTTFKRKLFATVKRLLEVIICQAAWYFCGLTDDDFKETFKLVEFVEFHNGTTFKRKLSAIVKHLLEIIVCQATWYCFLWPDG